jgi:hypothetical protein
MMKWYPILLLPLFVSYNVHAARSAAREQGRPPPPLGRALLSGVIVPGALAGAVCIAVLGITWLWDGGGLEAVGYVYEHHAGRHPNPSSIVTALIDSERWGWFAPELRDRISTVFTALAFGSSLLVALFPVRSREALLTGALTVVLGFVAFQTVFSPQWVVWISPIAILLAARRRSFLVLTVALELAIYLQAPLFYYEGIRPPYSNSAAFFAVCDTRIWLLIGFWAWSLGSFLRNVMPIRAGLAPATAEA